MFGINFRKTKYIPSILVECNRMLSTAVNITEKKNKNQTNPIDGVSMYMRFDRANDVK